MATEIAYEEITNTPFDVEALKEKRNTVALYAAVIIANNPDTKITLEDLLKKATFNELVALRSSIWEAMGEWAGVPDVMAKEEADTDTKKK